MCDSNCLALGSAAAGEMVDGVGLAAARAQTGIGSIAGKGGGVAISVVIAVVSSGGLGLLLGLMGHWTENPFDATKRHGFQGSFLDRMGFLLLPVCLPMIWRQGKDLLA